MEMKMGGRNRSGYSKNKHVSDALDWLNNFLWVDVVNVEELLSGTLACQVLDAIFPDTALQKVNFNANTVYDYTKNWKLFQQILTNNKIFPKRTFNFQSAAEGNASSNYELLQFLMLLAKDRPMLPAYNPIERREWALSTYLRNHPLSRSEQDRKGTRKLGQKPSERSSSAPSHSTESVGERNMMRSPSPTSSVSSVDAGGAGDGGSTGDGGRVSAKALQEAEMWKNRYLLEKQAREEWQQQAEHWKSRFEAERANKMLFQQELCHWQSQVVSKAVNATSH